MTHNEIKALHVLVTHHEHLKELLEAVEDTQCRIVHISHTHKERPAVKQNISNSLSSIVRDSIRESIAADLKKQIRVLELDIESA